MRKPTLTFGRLGVTALICLLSFHVYPQDVASLITLIGKSEGPMQNDKELKTKPLKRLLSELETRYKVSFNYDSELIRHVVVENREISTDLEPALNTLLEQQELKCRKIGDKTYVIYPKQETPEPKETSAAGHNDFAFANDGSGTQNASTTVSAVAATGGVTYDVKAVTVKGRVTDEKNEGLPGVSVVLKGSTTGTSTDVTGNYSLTIPDGSGTLTFSYIGYISQEVPINNQTVVDVKLLADVKALSEVVVVGYGTQKRSDITGAIAVVDVKQTQKTQVASVAEQLQGRVAGVSVTSSGLPGQTSQVKIRGTGIFGNNNPLYVIDGLLTSDSRDFNPNDVETIQVLKDASATALYGTQAANGVVIITTKRGKEGPAKIDFKAYYGVQEIAHKLKLMNAQQFANITNAAYDAAGETRMPGTSTKFDPSIDTDWQKEFFKTGAIQNYNLTISGGSKTSNYLVSGDIFDQQGTVIGPSFKRYTLRVNSGTTRGKFNFGESILLSRSNTVDLVGRPFNDVIRMLPTIPVYSNDAVNFPGGYGFGSQDNYTFGSNPIAMQKLQDNYHISNRMQGTVFGEYAITSFLKYKLNLGLEYQNFQDHYFRKFGIWSYNNPVEPTYLDENRGERYTTLVENTLTFNKSFGKHNVTALVGYVEQQIHFGNTQAINRGYSLFNGQYLQVLSAGTQNPSSSGQAYNQALRSYLGRITYDYASKYYFTVSARRDGVSRFGPGQKWGTFPAGSLGWRVSNEEFFQSGPSWITNLMVRASYGITGNSTTDFAPYGGSYPFLAVINTNTNYVFGTGQTVTPGATQQQLVNSDIKWQSKKATDIGIDLGLFQNKLLITADYYETKTSGLLVQVPLPWTSGNDGGDPYNNNGLMRNRGLELAITYQETAKAFNYSISGNITTVKNKILALAFDRPIYGPGNTKTAVGGELGQFFVVRTDGIFQNQAEIDASAQKNDLPKPQPGDVRFKDTNGRGADGNLTGKPDGKIDNDDREYVGSGIPKFEYGINLTAAYKGFDFTAFFSGVYGNTLFNTGKWWGYRTDDNQNHPADMVPWTAEGAPYNAPRAVYRTGGVSNSRYNQDTWLESGSFFRLRNIQLGYSIPSSVLKKVQALNNANLRIYVSAQNLFTITKYTGYNPEVPGEGLFGRGVDDGNYPTSRVITGGIQFGF